jgi:hypothetical protein
MINPQVGLALITEDDRPNMPEMILFVDVAHYIHKALQRRCRRTQHENRRSHFMGLPFILLYILPQLPYSSRVGHTYHRSEKLDYSTVSLMIGPLADITPIMMKPGEWTRKWF